MHRAQTVGARVAPADYDDAFVLSRNEFGIGNEIAFTPLVLQR